MSIVLKDIPDELRSWYQELLVTIEELKQHTHLGRQRPDLKPAGIRSWRVKRFSHWLIF